MTPQSDPCTVSRTHTTEENLRTFGGWVRRYGRPLAHYTDKNSIFRKPARSRFPNNSGEIRCERSFGEP